MYRISNNNFVDGTSSSRCLLSLPELSVYRFGITSKTSLSIHGCVTVIKPQPNYLEKEEEQIFNGQIYICENTKKK